MTTYTMTPSRRRMGLLPARWLTAALALIAQVSAFGQTPADVPAYPNKPITVVVPFSPGGPDRVIRLLGDALQESMKQPVVLDYRPGATGLIGASFVKGSKADGYTLVFTSNSGMVIAPMLRNPPPFDPPKDFVPVSMVARNPIFLVVPGNHPANTLDEFIKWVKANPTTASYASPGNGSLGHLAAEMFLHAAGISMIHVPYKGVGDAQNGLMSGSVHLFLDAPGSAGELVRARKVKALALIADARIAPFPDVPTMKELGYGSVSAVSWLGLLGPKGMPDAIVKKLATEIDRALRTDKLRDMISMGGVTEVVGGSPDRLAKEIEAETPGFRRLVKDLNLRVD